MHAIINSLIRMIKTNDKTTMSYKAKTFNIPNLKGISAKNIEEHLNLYSGYVKHVNLILEELKSPEGEGSDAFKYSEMRRRLSFEFDGMRNHEYYFGALDGGSVDINKSSKLYQKIEEQWGSYDNWKKTFTSLAKTRGVGWAILYYDKQNDVLINNWVDEQHLGHLMSLSPVLALDMWEHSYVGDYWSSGKGQYIEDFFANINWKFVENTYEEAL